MPENGSEKNLKISKISGKSENEFLAKVKIQENSLFKKLTNLRSRIRSWAKSEKCKKIEIESKFRINDSSKILTQSLDNNIDFYVSLKNSTLKPSKPKSPKYEKSPKNPKKISKKKSQKSPKL
jgi:hypothetical protein